MKTKLILITLAVSLLGGSVLADTMDPIVQQPSWRWVAALNAGPVWEDGGHTQTFYLTSTIEKTYVANKSTTALFYGEFFLGLQKTFSQIIQGQLGLAAAVTNTAKLSGIIWDDASPEFSNFTYEYKIQHTHLALKAKLVADTGYFLSPWLSGSIGIGFNNAHGFHSLPLIFEAVPTPDFSSHTKTTCSYTLGAGVQKSLNCNWQIGIGYEFADWGRSNLGRAAAQTLNTGLVLNTLYINGILLNLTYIA